MSSVIALIISVLALMVSVITAWLTLLHRGKIRMTQPTVIFFGPDGRNGPPKLFLRTLLYSTSRRGQVIKSMHVRVIRGESAQNFNIWVYGDDILVRGSGLFVGQQGVGMNHHFLLPKDGTNFQFFEGDYNICIYITLVNKSKPILLDIISVNLSLAQSNAIIKENAGIFFDWGPDQNDYQSHIDYGPSDSGSLNRK